MAASAVLVVAAIVAASTTIASLQNRNKRLAGFRPVCITTTPRGARVALVPLDPNTNEPDPDPASIVRPCGTTPLTTELKAGTYLVEAVLPGDDETRFCGSISNRLGFEPSYLLHLMRANKEVRPRPGYMSSSGISKLCLRVETIEKMVQIAIPEDVREANPSLPAKLYVDAKQTTPAELASQARIQAIT